MPLCVPVFWGHCAMGSDIPKGWVARTFVEPAVEGLAGTSKTPSPSFPPNEVCLFHPKIPFTLGNA